MSTTAQLSENSHQGFEAAKRMLCLAAMQVKSNTASGMPVCLQRNGIGSRSSSKERDAETGLDYLGFRYYSSPQGKWISPDQPFADQLLTARPAGALRVITEERQRPGNVKEQVVIERELKNVRLRSE